ncbi:hypothetical protein [Actinomadura terrae]|uniref:hypothetical protein n=1 Tax=Actinomadura terrae TaxID=604353 RepID=UPI001FA72143|nr:hypothetical protein [Actinomadura terrae]
MDDDTVDYGCLGFLYLINVVLVGLSGGWFPALLFLLMPLVVGGLIWAARTFPNLGLLVANILYLLVALVAGLKKEWAVTLVFLGSLVINLPAWGMPCREGRKAADRASTVTASIAVNRRRSASRP